MYAYWNHHYQLLAASYYGSRPDRKMCRQKKNKNKKTTNRRNDSGFDCHILFP